MPVAWPSLGDTQSQSRSRSTWTIWARLRNVARKLGVEKSADLKPLESEASLRRKLGTRPLEVSERKMPPRRVAWLFHLQTFWQTTSGAARPFADTRQILPRCGRPTDDAVAASPERARTDAGTCGHTHRHDTILRRSRSTLLDTAGRQTPRGAKLSLPPKKARTLEASLIARINGSFSTTLIS